MALEAFFSLLCVMNLNNFLVAGDFGKSLQGLKKHNVSEKICHREVYMEDF